MMMYIAVEQVVRGSNQYQMIEIREYVHLPVVSLQTGRYCWFWSSHIASKTTIRFGNSVSTEDGSEILRQ